MKIIVFKNNTNIVKFLGKPIALSIPANSQMILTDYYNLAEIDFCSDLRNALNDNYGPTGFEITDGTQTLTKTEALNRLDLITESVSGIITTLSQASCRVYTTAGQSITNSAWNTVNWAKENYDTQNMHNNVTNNSRVTIPTNGEGKYLVTASLSFTANATGVRGIRLQKNGTGEERRVLNQTAGASEFISTEISDVLHLLAGDYLEIAAWQNSGISLNLLTGADRNHFAVTKLH